MLPRRFSVPLFKVPELDRGIRYEQGDRHRRNKRLCIPIFEQKRSIKTFVGATREELDAISDRFRRRASKGERETFANEIPPLW